MGDGTRNGGRCQLINLLEIFRYYFLCVKPFFGSVGTLPDRHACNTQLVGDGFSAHSELIHSQSLSACCRVSLTKFPLPSILASPFSRSSPLRPRRPLTSPPALLIKPPPRRSSRVPCLIPFSTNSRYFWRAAFWVSPKWRRTSSMVFSARDFVGSLGSLSLLGSLGSSLRNGGRCHYSTILHYCGGLGAEGVSRKFEIMGDVGR